MIRRFKAAVGFASPSLMKAVDGKGRSLGFGRIMYRMIRGIALKSPSRARGVLKGISDFTPTAEKRFTQVEGGLHANILNTIDDLNVV